LELVLETEFCVGVGVGLVVGFTVVVGVGNGLGVDRSAVPYPVGV